MSASGPLVHDAVLIHVATIRRDVAVLRGVFELRDGVVQLRGGLVVHVRRLGRGGAQGGGLSA